MFGGELRFEIQRNVCVCYLRSTDKEAFRAVDHGKEALLSPSGANTGIWQEPKALLAHPAVTGEIDWEAATRYLLHEYVPAPYAIYRGCKPPAGCHFFNLTNGASVGSFGLPLWGRLFRSRRTRRELLDFAVEGRTDLSSAQKIDFRRATRGFSVWRCGQLRNCRSHGGITGLRKG